MSATDNLFEEVVRNTGLPAFIGPSLVRRALAGAGAAKAEEAAPADFERALPELKARMNLYLNPGDTEKRLRDIAAILLKRA